MGYITADTETVDTYNVIRYIFPLRATFAFEDFEVIKSFFDRGTEDIFNRVRSKAARKTCPETIWLTARRKLDQLNAAITIESLSIPPGNRLETLKDDRRGQHSIRVNDQFRVCFVWTEEGPERVLITDYH
jgi:proteic killer suppression protein